WAFTLIIISSYTANLAAFLTVQRMEVPVESADDLADQTNIEYGTIHAGSTMTFFQVRGGHRWIRRPIDRSIDRPHGLSNRGERGRAGGGGAGVGFPPSPGKAGGTSPPVSCPSSPPLAGSPFRDEITLAILQLQENNRLEILKRKWWEGGHCPKEEDHRAKGLGMENIGGIFVVLVCGLVVAILVAVMEFVWSTRRSAETEE
ncbi:glutamate receptor ionotropic, kainate 5-like, partial [Onychostruthus taczanowskii]|uniref:glutamate receptor ionotropic, kainate 5-like n=1 Tax=Onychostruthus taczanowskii TaxID=356909 RepID=UPI001B80AB84